MKGGLYMIHWEQWESKCLSCHKCNLAQTRNHVVLGVGNPLAEVLFIGEAPGENEDLKGEPFIGRGGKLLDQMLLSVGLSRKENIYIANVVKCRPPQNRDPLPAEREACLPWLEEQIQMINPKIIVCLGRVAACGLMDKNFKVTKEHGQFREINGRLYMGTLHPAAVLRDPRKKEEWHEDFVILRQKMEEICSCTRFVEEKI